MSRAETATDDDDDEFPFVRCDECEKFYVRAAVHTCRDANGPQTRADRLELADADDRADDDRVLFLLGRSDRAYHETELTFDLDDMRPRYECVCGPIGHKREFESKTRKYAKLAGRYPCAHCRNKLKRSDE